MCFRSWQAAWNLINTQKFGLDPINMNTYGITVINKRPTEYKEVDDKDWIRESYEKFNEYSRLSELVKSKERIII